MDVECSSNALRKFTEALSWSLAARPQSNARSAKDHEVFCIFCTNVRDLVKDRSFEHLGE